MSEEDRFLSRWSRRKQAARLASKQERGTAGAETKPPTAADGTAGDASAGSGEAAGGLPGLSEEELAKLPRLDALTAASDVTMFLRAGVPETLRNAALRRVWALDPKIRDYVSEAREYAYDWNRPGDVPGNGPLPAGFDIRAVVGRLFRDQGAAGESRAAAAAQQAATRAGPLETDAPDDSAVLRAAGAGTREALPTGGTACAAPAAAAPPDPVVRPGSESNASPDERPKASRQRRHGGAIPL